MNDFDVLEKLYRLQKEVIGYRERQARFFAWSGFVCAAFVAGTWYTSGGQSRSTPLAEAASQTAGLERPRYAEPTDQVAAAKVAETVRRVDQMLADWKHTPSPAPIQSFKILGRQAVKPRVTTGLTGRAIRMQEIAKFPVGPRLKTFHAISNESQEEDDRIVIHIPPQSEPTPGPTLRRVPKERVGEDAKVRIAIAEPREEPSEEESERRLIGKHEAIERRLESKMYKGSERYEESGKH